MVTLFVMSVESLIGSGLCYEVWTADRAYGEKAILQAQQEQVSCLATLFVMSVEHGNTLCDEC